MKRFYALLMVLVSICLVTAVAQADGTRRIEGQAAFDTEHNFSITLPSGWQFDPIPKIHPCFRFRHIITPDMEGSISASKRLGTTARQRLDEWVAGSKEEWVALAQDFMMTEVPYEVSPVSQTQLGTEEALSCIEMSPDGVRLNIFAARGDISYHLSMSAPEEQYDTLMRDAEFIRKNFRFE